MKIDKKLLNEIDSQVPNLSQQIKSQIDWEIIKVNNSKQVKQNKKSFTLKMSLVSAFSLVLICSVLMIPSILKPNTPPNNPNEPKPYLITIDVNPSIRLEVNKDDIVTTQYGLNEDGVILLHKENFVGKTADEATELIVDKLQENGFLETNDIKISVKDTDKNDYKDKENEIKENLKDHIKNFEGVVLNDLQDADLDEIENYYNNNNVKNYEKEVASQYRTKIIEKANEKLLQMKTLLLILDIFRDENGEFIINFPFQNQIDDFFNKYEDDDFKNDFNHSQPSYKDLSEFCFELEEKIAEIENALTKIEQGSNEEEFEDVLDDLYDLVEDDLFEERRNNNQNKPPKNNENQEQNNNSDNEPNGQNQPNNKNDKRKYWDDDDDDDDDEDDD